MHVCVLQKNAAVVDRVTLLSWRARVAAMERSRSYSGNVPSNTSVKIGGLWKRSQGLSRLTRPNYRHRVFILTEQALSYYSGTVDRVGQLKGRVNIDSITAVEFVDESAFSLPHTFQVVYQTKKSGFVILYVTSSDSTECSDWVATLRQACYFNKEMAMHYHPGALLRNRWSCCRQHGKTSLGCQPTYHLLTRSSSRYAQMRRKDTLTSSHGSHGRRSKSTSLSRGEGRSATPEPRAREEARRSGSRGLSNSCCDLTHKQVQNRFDEPTAADTVSRHSSQLSNEPSISVGCITLTRVSLSELGGQPFSPPASTHVAKIGHPGRSKVVSTEGKSEGKSKGNRMQVAPEITSGIHSRAFPLSESHPHLPPRAPFTALPNRFTQSASTHFTPPSSHVTNYHCLTEPRRSRHSKTEGTANTQLSASTSLFPPKPVLEPKVSATDPNTIHF